MQISIQRGSGVQKEGEQLTGTTRTWSSPIGFTLNGEAITQVATGMRWTDIDVWDRENETNEIEFTIVRIHATIEAAEVHIMDRKTALRGEWSVIFSLGQVASKNYLRWIKTAVVRASTMSYEGLKTTIRYRITGGRIRSTSDTA